MLACWTAHGLRSADSTALWLETNRRWMTKAMTSPAGAVAVEEPRHAELALTLAAL